MKQPKIIFRNIWCDDSILELEVVAQTEVNEFNVHIYIGYNEIPRVKSELEIFNKHIHGGIYDLNLGKFGSEYAYGALSARFHFQSNGHINITLSMQSQYFNFGKKHIANETLLHLQTELALLDKFIEEITTVSTVGNYVELICIEHTR